MELVRFQRPQLPPSEEIEHYFRSARYERWFSNSGPCHELFRQRLGAAVGRDAACVPVSSGTLGLMLALRACVGSNPKRREVIVPSFTFIASVSAILWCDLEPVFVDVAPDHWHLDPAQLTAALDSRSSRVAAVVACSTFGAAPPVAVHEAWQMACRDAGVPLIVDSAPGFGSLDEDGQPLGLQGDVEVFSFHATKPLAIGEGGAVFSADAERLARVSVQSAFGLKDRVLVDTPGLNAKMSEVHAATGLAALDRLPQSLEARRERALRLRAGLEDLGFTSQAQSEASSLQFLPLLAGDAQVRDEALRLSVPARVELRSYHPPLHSMAPLHSCIAVGDLPVTRELSQRILSLPLAVDMTSDAIDRVRAVLRDAASGSVG